MNCYTLEGKFVVDLVPSAPICAEETDGDIGKWGSTLVEI